MKKDVVTYMDSALTDRAIEVFSTCPVPGGAQRHTFLRNVIDVARWSEEAGCKGILVYADNSLIDPWMLCQIILENMH